MSLLGTYTSTGEKMFAHQEAMTNLRNGKGQCIVSHVMLTDVCQHTCAFCSVQARAGDSLVFDDVMAYLDILRRYGLKAVILSGGGNPILYKCKNSGKNFNDVVDEVHQRGLEIGLITNGMQLRKFGDRNSWVTVRPSTLDKLTWVRISMAGLDHDEQEVYVPDIDPTKTTLGFSYVAHDIYEEPADPHHGKVSTRPDILSGNRDRAPTRCFEERIGELVGAIRGYVKKYSPRYVRLLPNCLEPDLIGRRCGTLSVMAREIDPDVAFVQYKPPAAPKVCLLGAVHPVLNCDGYVFPCDSCVLNESAGHAFSNPWRICHWSEIAKLYDNELPRSLIDDPSKLCPGCVFTKSNEILLGVRNGTIDPVPPTETPTHVNFI